MEQTNQIVEKDLKKALERNEFCLYYQPKLDLISGKIIGFEALIRWKHPKKGMIAPLEFISFAEETGLIIPIGEWVLRTACLQNKKWQDAGYFPLNISVNLSPRQLYQENLVEQVKDILKETNLSPQYLTFEITEGIMLDTIHAPKVMKELKNIGVQISLDDFGTGYNSLYYLQEIPFDMIKIDKSFVQKCMTDYNNAAIIKSTIDLAHRLNMKVIAEGVETKEQLIFLQQNRCNFAQGFLFNQPKPSSQIIESMNTVEQIVIREGIPQQKLTQRNIQEMIEKTQKEAYDTIRMQQGMIFKYKKINGKFIHTLCDGQLIYKMGITPEHVVGKDLYEFLPFEDAKRKDFIYERTWEEEKSITYEGNLNGVHYLASLRPIKSGGKVTEVIGTGIDISERRQMDEALRFKHSLYSIITENIQDLICVVDLKGGFDYFSSSYKKILGYVPNVWEGKMFFNLIHPEDRERIKKEYMEVTFLKSPKLIELRIKNAIGDWMDLEAKVTPVLDDSGEVQHIVTVARDISERKKKEQYMRKSERLSIASQLATSIAHEVRNPLTTIKGFFQLFQEEGHRSFYMDTILSEIDRLEEVVTIFLNFSEPRVTQIKESNLDELLEDLLLVLNTQASRKSITIVKEAELNLPLLECDQRQMKHVFDQILQNSMEAMPDGGVIKIQLFHHDSKHVKIRFTDTGKGMSEERLKKIGEPFYSIQEKGTGLGLMICHKIVREHGGWMDIDSALDRGTIVDVILPVKQGRV